MDADVVEVLGRALLAGRVGENEFILRTREFWLRRARDVWYRWRAKLPASAAREDVEQEYLLQVLAHARQWDESRGMSLVDFVLWGARRRTQRAIHEMRGARIHGNEGRNPGRPEVTFTAFAEKRKAKTGDAEREVDPCDLVPVFATQDARAAVREFLAEALGEARSVREAFSLLALEAAGGDPDDAAVRLFESFSARVECELRDVEHARRVVGKALEGVVGTDAYEELVGAA